MNKTPSSTVLILNLSYMDQLLKNSKLCMVLVTERDLTFESFYCRKQKLSHSRKQQVLSRVSSEPVRTCAGFFFFFFPAWHLLLGAVWGESREFLMQISLLLHPTAAPAAPHLFLSQMFLGWNMLLEREKVGLIPSPSHQMSFLCL